MNAPTHSFPVLDRFAALKPGGAVRILPAGTFRAHDGRPVGVAGWRIDAAIAAALVATRAPGSTDYMIDYEHQSLNSVQNGKPSPAAGWFKRLEWREGDGLYMADITWTDGARAMIAAMEYRHISPVFSFDPNSGVVTRIISVAMTNTPALNGLSDLAAARAALTSQTSQTSHGAIMTPDERCKFICMFGIDPMPGTPFQADYKQPGACSTLAPNLDGMSFNAREKFKRIFGHVFDAIGQPLT